MEEREIVYGNTFFKKATISFFFANFCLLNERTIVTNFYPPFRLSSKNEKEREGIKGNLPLYRKEEKRLHNTHVFCAM